MSEELDARSIFPEWDELLTSSVQEEDSDLSQLLDDKKDQAYWETLFNEMNFPGMDLMAVTYFQPIEKPLESHLIFRRLARDFVRFLGYHHATDLRSAGISEEGLFYMKKGILPENFVVHLKYPPEYGGLLDFDNMVLIQNLPFHEDIHRYMDKQRALSPNPPELLYVPVPPTKIYVPFGQFTGSGGKNKQDRSVFAGFSASAFKQIALKNMPGR